MNGLCQYCGAIAETGTCETCEAKISGRAPATTVARRQPWAEERPAATRTCPFCLSEIPSAASVCRYCTRDVNGAAIFGDLMASMGKALIWMVTVPILLFIGLGLIGMKYAAK